MGTIEYVAVGDARLWTARQGSGPPLALLHGGPGMWDYLGPVAAMLDDQATVYRYDQRACGRTSGNPRYGMTAAVEDLDALRAQWDLDAWVVAGHSFGATL
ncbi:MAG TPA: alpha/beta fold hydrolase, partial [Chloroflexota bacterium]